jgi:hypothetical protein
MPSETTYARLRENLATMLAQVVDQQETVMSDEEVRATSR